MSFCKYNNCNNYISNNNLICDNHIKLLNIYEKPIDCPICLKTLTDEFPLFPCAHWTCKTCILNSSNHNCPFCRQPIYLTLEESNIINTNITRLNKASEIQQIEDDRLLAEQLNNESDNENDYEEYHLSNFMNGIIFGETGRYSITEMYNDIHDYQYNTNIPNVDNSIMNIIASMIRRTSTDETDEDDYLD